jgi:hypothetical protein
MSPIAVADLELGAPVRGVADEFVGAPNVTETERVTGRYKGAEIFASMGRT